MQTRPYFILVYLFYLSMLFASNDTIKVYLGDNKTVMGKIEDDIINNVLLMYQRSSKETINYRIIKVPTFDSLIKIINSTAPEEKNNFVAISQITITDERRIKFDFSNPYAPIKTVFIGLKGKTFKLNMNTKVGFIKNTIHEKLLDHYPEPIKISFESVPEANNALKTGKIDYLLGDNVNSWENPAFKVMNVLKKQPGYGYGFLYLKGSELKKVLDNFLKYYMSSVKFKRIIMNYFGEEIKNYYIDALKKNIQQ